MPIWVCKRVSFRVRMYRCRYEYGRCAGLDKGNGVDMVLIAADTAGYRQIRVDGHFGLTIILPHIQTISISMLEDMLLAKLRKETSALSSRIGGQEAGQDGGGRVSSSHLLPVCAEIRTEGLYRVCQVQEVFSFPLLFTFSKIALVIIENGAR